MIVKNKNEDRKMEKSKKRKNKERDNILYYLSILILITGFI